MASGNLLVPEQQFCITPNPEEIGDDDSSLLQRTDASTDPPEDFDEDADLMWQVKFSPDREHIRYVDVSTDPMDEDPGVDTCLVSHDGATTPISVDTADCPMDARELDGDWGRSGCSLCCSINFTKRELFEECKIILWLAWPTSLYFLLNSGINITPLIFNGHLGTTELSAAALAISVVGVTVKAMGMGFTTACDTFFSQTFGSPNKTRVGIELQKAILCTFAVVILVVVLCLNAEVILVQLGQDPVTSAYVGSFLTLYLPAIPADLLCLVLIKYLQCHSILLPIVAILLSVNAINIGCHHLFMTVLGLGFWGSPLALVVTTYSQLFHLLAFIFLKGVYKNTWSGWSLQCLVGWGKFYKLGMAGSFMVCFEWWSFEIGVFLAGLLGVTQLGVQGVALQIITFAYMIPLGVSIILGIRIGSKLGANRPREAVITACSGILVCWFFAGLESLVCLLTRNVMGYIFTKEEEVVQQTSEVMLIFCILVLFDNTAAACSGIVRGTGRQVLGAAINFVGFYFIGLPICAVLMLLTPLEVKGYWIGQTIGLVVQSILFIFYVSHLNWPLEARRALKKAGVHLPVDEEGVTNALPLADTTDQSAVRKEQEADSILGSSERTANPDGASNQSADGYYSSSSLDQSPCTIPSNEEASTRGESTREESMQYVVIKRLLLLTFFTGVLISGILCRIYIPYDCSVMIRSNTTCLASTTDAMHG